MANKQPFYHAVEILFTTTTGRYLTKQQKEKIAVLVQSFKGILKGSIMIDETEPEPGDPADLL